MRILLRALILILALLLASALGRDEPAVPDLSGRWTLDPDKSEDGRQKMRDAMPTRVPAAAVEADREAAGPAAAGCAAAAHLGAVRPAVATRSARACAA